MTLEVSPFFFPLAPWETASFGGWGWGGWGTGLLAEFA